MKTTPGGQPFNKIGNINNMDERAKTISKVNGTLINTNAIKRNHENV